MNLIWKLIMLAAVVASAIWWADADQGNSAQTPIPSGYVPAPRQQLLNPSETYHGLAWQIHRSEDCVKEAKVILKEIADLGADTVLISNAGYQEHAGSESFQIDPAVTPSPEQWQQIFKMAHDNGLRVVLMPIILLSEPRGTEWRGVINPPSWDDWFEQYRNFLLHFARIAADGKVEVMTVGSELVSTEKYVDKWRRVIREVRQAFSGKLSYSANWDHYKMVEFWDELDLVSMTSYYKLAADPNPSLESLIEAWKPIKRGLLRWQQRIGKPLLFTEVGWCSQDGASIEPWNYYHSQEATATGQEEQRRCYRAFIETWKNTPEVGGFLWWEWTNCPGGKDDYNYTPKGKTAEGELRAWFGAVRQLRRAASKPSPKPQAPPSTSPAKALGG